VISHLWPVRTPASELPTIRKIGQLLNRGAVVGNNQARRQADLKRTGIQASSSGVGAIFILSFARNMLVGSTVRSNRTRSSSLFERTVSSAA
jgi:hypothetical protein